MSMSIYIYNTWKPNDISLGWLALDSMGQKLQNKGHSFIRPRSPTSPRTSNMLDFVFLSIKKHLGKRTNHIYIPSGKLTAGP